MSRGNESHQSNDWQWEKALVEAYYDYRWHKLLDPLCDTFKKWKAGELTHADVDRAIDEAYKERCLINNLFGQRRDRSVALINWWDRDWFEAWVNEHRPPSDFQSPSLPESHPPNE